MARTRSRRPRGLYHRAGRGWYGDFRKYADVGGKQEALIPKGATRATDDPDVAAQLYAGRLQQLDQARRDGVLGGQRKRRPNARRRCQIRTLQDEVRRFSRRHRRGNEPVHDRRLCERPASRHETEHDGRLDQ